MTVQRGPDFLVYRIRAQVKVGTPETEIGVYIGSYPDYQHRQNESSAKVTESPGRLLDKSVSWHTWQSGSQSFESEAIVALDEYQKLHVFVSGSKDDLAKLRKSAESMRKVPRTK